MSQPPSGSEDPPSFSDFTHYTLTHTFLPLVFKRVFDECGSKAFESAHLIPGIAQAESDAALVQQYAETNGSLVAEQRWTSTDVLMSALVASVNRVHAVGLGSHTDLQNTITIGRKALANTWTDPKFVGATHNHRLEGVSGTSRISLTERTQRPDMAGQGVNVIPRSHAFQRLNGIQKPEPMKRRSLPDKAKATLERWFQNNVENPYPTDKEKKNLASLCGVTLTNVNTWFGNKRMRIKRKMLQVECQGGGNTTNNVLAPRSKWDAVVMSKMTSQAGREVLASATGLTIPGRERIASEEYPKLVQEQIQQSDSGRRESNHQ